LSPKFSFPPVAQVWPDTAHILSSGSAVIVLSSTRVAEVVDQAIAVAADTGLYAPPPTLISSLKEAASVSLPFCPIAIARIYLVPGCAPVTLTP